LSFELIRMLCVNSYKQGKVIELRLADGHVLILGRNGAGKTTLAQLIPLFYGVPASHIVDRSGGRSPITEFLLRGRASYLVFEYRRHDDANGEDGLRTVVLRSDDEGRMVYQFFRGGYDQRLFITEARTYRDYADLRAAATTRTTPRSSRTSRQERGEPTRSAHWRQTTPASKQVATCATLRRSLDRCSRNRPASTISSAS
jgi:predicted ATPase